MTEPQSIDIYYSLQSDYCYFLNERMLKLSKQDVRVNIRPVLGLVLRAPEMTADRQPIEFSYFDRDTKRTADFLGLPHVYPDPSPIQFEPNCWVASKEQPRVERLYRLFVGATRAGKGMDFLRAVVNRFWDGSQSGWDQSPFLYDAFAEMGLNHDQVSAQSCSPTMRLW